MWGVLRTGDLREIWDFCRDFPDRVPFEDNIRVITANSLARSCFKQYLVSPLAGQCGDFFVKNHVCAVYYIVLYLIV